ncbi:major facilitator superfamily domain-containing protein [Syncephalastrum racemosum]|uniref:Major facilitator superfamily domain-containing protein n=1 Tax=Syncephalastrum racemosum TaxID=13706 RepID=A0A1X2HPU4_SYNRA|nr:major facilitator superfamily domain-containing protein [Syncephalastrum racemosum]
MSVGAIVAPLGMVLASYVTSMWQVYLTQGVLFGLGGAFVFSCSVTLPTQWFYKNRGLATGIAVSGSGIGGVALAPLSTHLIQQLGYRQALRVLGGMYFGILCIAVGLARARWRPPPSPTKGIGAFWDPSMATSSFALLMLFSVLVPFGYVGPFFLAPTYASYLGQSQQTGSNMVSIMCGMNAVCRISLGFLADKSGRLNTMFACTFLAGLFTMVIWQFADSYGIYVAFCVLYGLTGGGWVSLFPVVAAGVVGVKNIQRGIGLCYFSTMFGNLVGTPIIGLLQSYYGWTAAIQFAGAPTVAAGLVMLALRFKLHPKLFKRA